MCIKTLKNMVWKLFIIKKLYWTISLHCDQLVKYDVDFFIKDKKMRGIKKNKNNNGNKN